MKKPILGKQTSIKDYTEGIPPNDKFIIENFKRNYDVKPLYTGRYFLILKNGVESFSKTKKLIESTLGFTVANSKDFKYESFNEDKIQDADALIYNDLGIALIGVDESQVKILESISKEYIIQPEKIVYVPDEEQATVNEPSTWGLKKIEAVESKFTGLNVKVAVLDTGFDINHPDFINRNIITSSFVPNETINDKHGHGTHCIGTACGNLDKNQLRYGVAKNSIIYAGKVLSNQGSGAQAWILNGMNWAANSGCKVISMSLGSSVYPGQSFDIAYERAAQFAMTKGAVVVAAAGNDSNRSNNLFNPVSSPADCPSILAIAALDSNLSVANFSNRAINTNGLIDLAAPGVKIYSSWPQPLGYNTISGTSMATPHVAGIIALLWEKFPNYTPYQIIFELKKLAKVLLLPKYDIGDGLAIAP